MLYVDNDIIMLVIKKEEKKQILISICTAISYAWIVGVIVSDPVVVTFRKAYGELG